MKNPNFKNLSKIILLITVILLSNCRKKTADNVVGSLIPVALTGQDSSTQPTTNPEDNGARTTPDVIATNEAVELPMDVPIQDSNAPNNSTQMGQSQATTNTPPEDANLYSNLTITFPESVDKAQVESEFLLLDLDGNQVEGAFYWDSSRKLHFDPYTALLEDTEYTIRIPGQNIEYKFKTGSAFNMTHRVNGSEDLTGSGLVIDADQAENANLTLVSEVPYPEKIKSVKLYKLGVNSFQEVDYSTGRIEIDLLSDAIDSALQPTNGGNTYYYCLDVAGNGDCNYVRSFSFIYGKLQKEPDAAIEGGIVATLDQSALNTIGDVLRKFATEQFTLKGMSLNGVINEKADRNLAVEMTDPTGQTCRLVEENEDMGTRPNFQYLKKIGPFCNKAVNGTVKYKPLLITYDLNFTSLMDVYITKMEIPSGKKTGEEAANFQAKLKPTDQSLDLDMSVQKAYGEMVIVLEMTGAAVDTLVGDLDLPSVLSTGKFVYKTPFIINGEKIHWPCSVSSDEQCFEDEYRTVKYPASNGDRTASVKANTIVSSNGDLLVNISNPPTYHEDYTEIQNWPSLNISEWDDRLAVTEVSDDPWYRTEFLLDGIVGQILKVIVKKATMEQLPKVQPEVVSKTVKDVAEKAVPDLINTLLSGVKEGITLDLPEYLPAPLGTMSIGVKGQPAFAKTGVDGDYAALETGLLASLTASNSDTSLAKPASVQGAQGFVTYKQNGLASQIQSSNTANPGVLLSVHMDSVNQALYQVWKAGGLNLTVDKTTTDLVKQIMTQVGTKTSLLELSESLLNAGAITTVFAPGRSVWKVKDAETGEYRNINPDDEVYAVSQPGSFPIASLYFDPDGEEKQIPKLNIVIGDFQLELRGKRKDSTSYLIAKVKLNLNVRAGFEIRKDGEIKDITVNINGTEKTFQSSDKYISVTVPIPASETDVSKGVFYTIEALRGPENNPLGLDPAGTESIIRPLVTSLVLPLVNNIMAEIPLPKVNACGLAISDFDVVAIDKTTTDPYMLIRASLDEYRDENGEVVEFTGDCSIDTILDR